MKGFVNRLLLLALLLIPAGSGASAEEYLDRVRNGGYDAIFVSKILAASTVPADHGGACYYKYEAEIVQSIQGKMRKARFEFSSRLGLAVGEEYLVYFSEADAKLHRFGSGPESECERRLTGYLLLYNELHRVDRVWDGEAFVKTVQFNDVWADISPAHEVDKNLKLVDFNYVKSQLSK